MKRRSLLGQPANEVEAWVAWYLKKLGAESLQVDTVLRAAMREEGKGVRATKTRIRKAVKRLLSQLKTSESRDERPAA
jgi:hypothetical protein